eukprot:CAMPEP_0201553516 /NCGR_PEP_ID=MMETSP0173_2-20130828/30146_1 /ASSEMBLY_ACC=CAM_ASM_000268 /TAXON_ID=218659 /ORGANISM="Vexillifera sp., Strain DIVA3 564/2" /LENGTH=337 /DNA_ID=CAMNT_0047964345 /DNA_START=55 /DNA_END=1068 /DNA_ORIENTATION=-
MNGTDRALLTATLDNLIRESGTIEGITDVNAFESLQKDTDLTEFYTLEKIQSEIQNWFKSKKPKSHSSKHSKNKRSRSTSNPMNNPKYQGFGHYPNGERVDLLTGRSAKRQHTIQPSAQTSTTTTTTASNEEPPFYGTLSCTPDQFYAWLFPNKGKVVVCYKNAISEDVEVEFSTASRTAVFKLKVPVPTPLFVASALLGVLTKPSDKAVQNIYNVCTMMKEMEEIKIPGQTTAQDNFDVSDISTLFDDIEQATQESKQETPSYDHKKITFTLTLPDGWVFSSGGSQTINSDQFHEIVATNKRGLFKNHDGFKFQLLTVCKTEAKVHIQVPNSSKDK